MDEVIKVERMRLWREAFVAYTVSRPTVVNIERAQFWAGAAVDAFDAKFKQNDGTRANS